MADALTAGMLRERFPPLVTPVRLPEGADAFAMAEARAGEAGAGTIFHGGGAGWVDLAVVLEPHQPLHVSRRALFPAMNALAATLAADCPPEHRIGFSYPGVLTFNHVVIGGGRLGWPEDTGAAEVPGWMVFGARIRTGAVEAVMQVLGEGSDIDADAFAARFCRHLMVELDDWVESGFREVGQRYLARLDRDDSGDTFGIDRNGDLLRVPEGGGATARSSYVDLTRAPEWLAAVTGARSA